MATSQRLANRPQRPACSPLAGSRRQHERVDLSRYRADAWLVLQPEGYSACQLLNLSYAGMCLQAEDLFAIGEPYRFILDLSAVLGTEVEVTARIVWKQSMDAGLCYAGAVFLRSSAPWLGPDEEEASSRAMPDFEGTRG